MTMNRRGLLTLRCLSPFGAGAGDTKAIWNLVIGAFLGFGVWDLELPPGPVHGEEAVCFLVVILVFRVA